MLHERIGEINNSIKLEEIKQKEAQGRLNKTKQQFPEIEEKYDFKTKEKSNIDFEVASNDERSWSKKRVRPKNKWFKSKKTFKNKIEKEKQDVEQRITTLMQEKQNLEKEFQQLEEKNAAANIDYEKASEEEKIAKDEFKKIEERHHSLFSKSIDLLSKYQKKK
ncbi:hypothetical protein ONA00_05350 [Mycoplasmopsis cynos]|uniref:hypothetical protein n=1 Tax=Mycoplasmopsis cynos TaxID=171284 RepID=UPI0024CB6E22|nr:hypothetical protein [Mycoplasmopsis cynos]WAM10737.1 hypothetical protein ONA00_05350 [Mycoplasmopsis cynos]